MMNKITIKSISGVLASLIAIVALSIEADSQTEMKGPVTQGDQKRKSKDLVVTRAFDAPAAEVWQYWVDPERVKKWRSPTGFTIPLARMDFREGGSSLVRMRSPEGQEFCSAWTYRKIAPMKRIEYIHNLADKDGKKADPVKMGMPPDFPQDVRNVITFKAVGDNKTEMTVTEYGRTSDQWFDLSKQGLEQCLDKMAAS